jgi:hypothetical protein
VAKKLSQSAFEAITAAAQGAGNTGLAAQQEILVALYLDYRCGVNRSQRCGT